MTSVDITKIFVSGVQGLRGHNGRIISLKGAASERFGIGLTISRCLASLY